MLSVVSLALFKQDKLPEKRPKRWYGHTLGGGGLTSHLAAVCSPRGQTSHLSSLIKATGICMTAPSPPLSAKAKDTEGKNPFTLPSQSSHTRGLWLPQVEARTWPSLLCTTNLIFFHPYCLPVSRKSAPPPAIPHRTLYYTILAIVVKNL